MLVKEDDWIWCGVPTKIASVLELFTWRKLCFIHTLIFSRKAVSVDIEDDDDDDDEAAVECVSFSF